LLPFGCKGWHSFDQVRRPYRVLSHRADFHFSGDGPKTVIEKQVLPEVGMAFRAEGIARTTAKRQRGVAPRRSVAGRLAFPASTLAFACFQAGLRGLPDRTALCDSFEL